MPATDVRMRRIAKKTGERDYKERTKSGYHRMAGKICSLKWIFVLSINNMYGVSGHEWNAFAAFMARNKNGEIFFFIPNDWLFGWQRVILIFSKSRHDHHHSHPLESKAFKLSIDFQFMTRMPDVLAFFIIITMIGSSESLTTHTHTSLNYIVDFRCLFTSPKWP